MPDPNQDAQQSQPTNQSSETEMDIFISDLNEPLEPNSDDLQNPSMPNMQCLANREIEEGKEDPKTTE
jgi:hypothetical protein